MTAFTMSVNLGESLSKIRNNFDEVEKKATDFAKELSGRGINVSAQLKEAHVSKKKRMSLGEGVDEAGTLGSPLKRFEISIYKTAVDVAVSEIDRRFSKNKELYRDLAALEPRLFKEIDELLANDKDALSKTYRLANVDQATL